MSVLAASGLHKSYKKRSILQGISLEVNSAEVVGLLGPNDVEIRSPSKRPSRIIESHLVNLHCLSELVDLTLFPQDENYV